ncbi:MAG: restriction endonuclease [Planctomycetes bacterium]|nr:restriction endonuclease [Planctomycetota bacterium]
MGDFFQRLGISPDDVEEIVAKSPSLRGFLVGYLAEEKLVEMYFKDFSIEKPDDHDRKSKGDRVLVYKSIKVRVEVKSLQTNSVREVPGGWTGRFQCDASDSRRVKLPNGKSVKTVCLVVGTFDLLAVNLFEFGQKWRFGFIHNNDLPRSTYEKYTPYQRKHLLQTTPAITWPLRPPFEAEPWPVLERIVRDKS